MGILRDNRLANWLFGVKGNAFESLDDVVGSGCVRGTIVNEQGNAPARYDSNKSRIELDTLLITKNPDGNINYRKLAKPKDYTELLKDFRNFYGLYGRGSQRCIEIKNTTGNKIEVDYELYGFNKRLRARIQLQIDKDTKEINVLYEQRGRAKEKHLLTDINRIFEVLDRNSYLFEKIRGVRKSRSIPVTG